ncbi:MAG: Hsp20/alpha crystallin family protein [Proteobacteria bacterium]|jgi:HSP20 family protein|nr:Hsp20/alpha crystallin family protein [Pseudomonadota bacterium]
MPNPSELALKNLQKILEREPMLRDIFNPSLPVPNEGWFSPLVDVVEDNDGYTILLEAPGVTRGSLTVDLDGTRLIVGGTKPKAHPAGSKLKVSERATGPFRREFLIPFSANGEHISAKLKDGVLTIHIPRHLDGKRHVEVN